MKFRTLLRTVFRRFRRRNTTISPSPALALEISGPNPGKTPKFSLMATITAVLKNRNKGLSRQPLWVFLRHAKVEVAVSVGVQLTAAEFQKGMVIGPLATEINPLINQIRSRLQQAYDLVVARGETLTNSALRVAYAQLLEPAAEDLKPVVAPPTGPVSEQDLLVSYLDKRLAEQQHKLSDSTRRGYQSVRQMLDRFNPNLRLQDMDRSGLYRLEAYLVQEGQNALKRGESGLKNSSIENYMTKVKTLLNYYQDEPGIQLSYKKYRFELPLPEENVLHFTAEEFKDFLAHEAPSRALEKQPGRVTTPGYERVKDIMTVLVATGLRYSDVFSDFRELVKTNRHQEQEIHIIPLKTRQKGMKAIIPVSPLLRQVLDRNNWKLRKMEDYHFNRLLREFCATIPSLQYPVTTIEYIGRQEIKTKEPKWKFLGSHTGRRTFINLCFEQGLTIPQIMSMTAHTDPSTLLVYANKTQNLAQDVGRIGAFQLAMP